MRWLPRHVGWEPYLHLVWLVFLLFQPFSDPGWTRLDWVYTALIVLLFLPLYFWTFTHERLGTRRVLWGVAGMALLGAVSVHVNSGSSSFFIYAASAAAFSGTPRFAWRVILGVSALLVVSAMLSPIPWPYNLWAFLPSLFFTAIIGGINIFEAEKARANARLRLAHDEIRRLATVAERERIARDLHDLLGHTLSVIALKSELAAKLAPADPGRAAREMAEVTEVSRDALREVREAVRGYRVRDLKTELAAVRGMLTAAEVRLEYVTEPAELPPEHEAVLALALREAVTNVVRHARAGVCRVELTAQRGWVRLLVTDDGLGKHGPDGAGLKGMRERAEGIGGTLCVSSTPGLRLELTLPLSEVKSRVADTENRPAELRNAPT